MTEAEKKLWFHLRANRLKRYKFKRQQPLGVYVVDFVCFDKRLVVEVDGSQHLDSERDNQRDAWLRANNFRVLRFWNNEVLQHAEQVLEAILVALENPSPQPLSRKGRGA